MTKSKKASIEGVITDCLMRRDDVVFAYIFGSFLTDYFREGKSDIDLGIYFQKDIDFFQISDLAYEIQKILPGNPEIDIVQMQQRRLIVNHEIFKNGKLLINRDPNLHERFLLTQWSQYIDFKISRRKLEADMKNPIIKENRIKGGK
ncbi:MAG: nucleotidyltransferase domain-containing protein [Saprospiraceae bacterium]|nr:nucleotidyltransferase domain-containing protein [Saprospiraceae bacterium]